MKKQYIIPATRQTIVSIERHLLAGSTDYAARDVTLSSGSASNSGAYSRGGGSFWDDDDE